MPYYAVVDGRCPGIYTSWADCAEEVNGWSRAVFRKFSTYDEAEDYLYSNVIIVYVHGSCLDNGMSNARAGYAVYFEDPELQHLDEAARIIGEQSISRAELIAITRAVRQAPNDNRDLVVCSGSQYAMNTVGTWIWKWRANGWLNAKGQPVANRDLIQKLEDELCSRSIRPELRHVPGHAGVEGN